MSSSEEYLESLLQSIMNGEPAGSPESVNGTEKSTSAIEMLTGEEPEQAILEDEPSKNSELSSEEMAEMLTSMVSDLDETDVEIGSDGKITDDMIESDDFAESDAEPSEMDTPFSNDMVDDLGLDGITFDDSGADDIAFGNANMDGLVSDELGMNDVSLDDLDMNDLALDDSDVDDLSLSDFGMDNEDPNNLNTDFMPSEDSGMDDLSLDDLGLDGLIMDDTSSDDMSLDDFGVNDMVFNDTNIDGGLSLGDSDADGIGLDDLGLDGLALDDSGMNDMGLDDLGLDGLALDDSGTDGMSLDNLGLDGLALDDSGTDDMGLDGLGLDNLALDDSSMNDMPLEEEGLNNMTIEDNGLDGMTDDLALGEDNMEEDIAEINDLLDQSGQEEEIDDEMLALLESVSDSTGEGLEGEDSNVFDFLQNDEADHENTELFNALEKEMQEEPQEESSDDKKKKRKEKKKRKKEKDAGKTAEIDIGIGKGNAGADETENVEKTEKKPGAFARFLAFLTESDEDELDSSNENGEATDENAELLAELNAEDKKAKKEKKKDKKAKKGKKAKEAADGENGEENDKASKKKKKPKKEKKVKEADEETAKEKPEKKLSRKKIVAVLLFCATITVGILIITLMVPNYLQKRDARIAYDMGNYDETYKLLHGKNLSEEDEIILHKSTIILSMERKLTSYQNCLKIGNSELESLNTLMQGAALYHALLPEAEQYNVINEVESIYEEILSILSSQYGLSEIDVMEIISSEDDVVYTERLTSIVYGISFDDGIGMDVEQESDEMADILPEEEEILEGLTEDMQDSSVGEEAFSAEPDAISDEVDTDNVDGTGVMEGDTVNEVSDDPEIKYIEPVAVEIHQN